MPISRKNIINHFIAVSPRKVNIKVGRHRAVWIEKTLKIQIELKRIHICNLQAIGNYRVAATTPAHIKETTAFGIANDVPRNKEVCIKAQVINNFKLFCNTVFCNFVSGFKAPFHSIQRKFFQ